MPSLSVLMLLLSFMYSHGTRNSSCFLVQSLPRTLSDSARASDSESARWRLGEQLGDIVTQSRLSEPQPGPGRAELRLPVPVTRSLSPGRRLRLSLGPAGRGP